MFYFYFIALTMLVSRVFEWEWGYSTIFVCGTTRFIGTEIQEHARARLKKIIIVISNFTAHGLCVSDGHYGVYDSVNVCVEVCPCMSVIGVEPTPLPCVRVLFFFIESVCIRLSFLNLSYMQICTKNEKTTNCVYLCITYNLAIQHYDRIVSCK